MKIALLYFRPLKSSNFAQLVARSGSQQGPICVVIILDLPSFSLAWNVSLFCPSPLYVVILPANKIRKFVKKVVKDRQSKRMFKAQRPVSLQR